MEMRRPRTGCSPTPAATRRPEGHSPTFASSRAASGPDSLSTWKPCSSRIGTLRETALSYFDPGLPPTTTKAVLFDTDDAALPPRARIASLAPSRLYDASDPVTTTDIPSSTRGVDRSTSSSRDTPAARHLSTM